MDKLAILEYSFLFESGNDTWTRSSEFENDLGKFFESHGLVAQVIETGGGTGRRVIYIKPNDKLDKLREEQPKPTKPTGTKLKEMAGIK